MSKQLSKTARAALERVAKWRKSHARRQRTWRKTARGRTYAKLSQKRRRLKWQLVRKFLRDRHALICHGCLCELPVAELYADTERRVLFCRPCRDDT